MARIEFEADTLQELVAMARRWVAAYPELETSDAAGTGARSRAPEALSAVLARISSPVSRQLLREIAVGSQFGEPVVVDNGLLERLGVPDRGSFVGVLGVVNRTMRRRAHRQLLSWDPDAHGYRMDADDARVVLGVVGAPASSPPLR